MSLSARATAFINSPTGPKTTHFWGPVANWGIVGSAILDTQKSPENVSLRMTSVLSLYSLVFMRFFWMVSPRNLFGVVTHVCNEAAQLTQLYRKIRYDMEHPDQGTAASESIVAVEAPPPKTAVALSHAAPPKAPKHE